LTFASAHDYGTDAIIIPVMLRLGNAAARTDAYLDTGSTFCVFKRSLAEPLGLEVETGEPLRLSTVTGSFDAYGHMLTLETFGSHLMSRSISRLMRLSLGMYSADAAG
jgi:hypothetical protein